MKKTVTANISGTLYNIEDDAFDLMSKVFKYNSEERITAI